MSSAEFAEQLAYDVINEKEERAALDEERPS